MWLPAPVTALLPQNSPFGYIQKSKGFLPLTGRCIRWSLLTTMAGHWAFQWFVYYKKGIALVTQDIKDGIGYLLKFSWIRVCNSIVLRPSASPFLPPIPFRK